MEQSTSTRQIVFVMWMHLAAMCGGIVTACVMSAVLMAALTTLNAKIETLPATVETSLCRRMTAIEHRIDQIASTIVGVERFDSFLQANPTLTNPAANDPDATD